MPGRQFNSNSYRYGYNGMEKDDELKGNGNSYDFGARFYDPRIGRLMSIDPLTKTFPNESPYGYAGNSPIYLVDDEGKKKTIYLSVISFDGTVTVQKIVVKDIVLEKSRHVNNTGGGPAYDFFGKPVIETKYYDIVQYATYDMKTGKITVTGEEQGEERSTSAVVRGIEDDLEEAGFTLKGGGGIYFTTAGDIGGGNEVRQASDLADSESENIDVLRDAISGPGGVGGGKVSAWLRAFSELLDAYGDAQTIGEETNGLGTASPPKKSFPCTNDCGTTSTDTVQTQKEDGGRHNFGKPKGSGGADAGAKVGSAGTDKKETP